MLRYHCCLALLWLAGPSLTSPLSLDLECPRLCEDEEDGGLTGDCCSTSYCDCSAEDEAQQSTCGGGQYFCPQYGGCLDFYGQQCDGETFDCCEEITTSTTTTAVSQTSSSLVTVTDSLDCSALCLTEQPGALTGDCCSTTFCVCSPAGGHPAACDAGQYFCPQHQTCLDFYGQQCDGQLFDCCPPPSTTTTLMTSTITNENSSPGSSSQSPGGVCSEVCSGKTGVVGDCCAPHYCDCDQPSQDQLCQPQHYFCPSFSTCINMYGIACSASLFDCCV